MMCDQTVALVSKLPSKHARLSRPGPRPGPRGLGPGGDRAGGRGPGENVPKHCFFHSPECPFFQVLFSLRVSPQNTRGPAPGPWARGSCPMECCGPIIPWCGPIIPRCGPLSLTVALVSKLPSNSPSDSGCKRAEAATPTCIWKSTLK